MNWDLSFSNIVGWIITLGIIGVGYWQTSIRRNAQIEGAMREIWTELKRQSKVDEELMSDDKALKLQIEDAIEWGERQVIERAAYNEKTFLKTEMYAVCHKNLEDKVAEIIAIDIKSRFVKLEMMVQQVLINQEELKAAQNKT